MDGGSLGMGIREREEDEGKKSKRRGKREKKRWGKESEKVSECGT